MAFNHFWKKDLLIIISSTIRNETTYGFFLKNLGKTKLLKLNFKSFKFVLFQRIISLIIKFWTRKYQTKMNQ